MNVRLTCLAGAIALASVSSAGESKSPSRYLAKPLTGDFYMYGGSLGDSTPPTEKDRKLSLMVTGPLAKDLFDHLGPDIKDACGAGPDQRERGKGDLSCILTKSEGYSCYVGLDVRTGKSMRGLTC